jgi:hypothetical protein
MLRCGIAANCVNPATIGALRDLNLPQNACLKGDKQLNKMIKIRFSADWAMIRI